MLNAFNNPAAYFVGFFNITDFDTCCGIKSRKRPSFNRSVPFVVNENLLDTEMLPIQIHNKEVHQAI